jgi:hypothetical protein
MEIRYLGVFPFCIVAPDKFTVINGRSVEDAWPIVLTLEEAVAAWWKAKTGKVDLVCPAIDYEYFSPESTINWEWASPAFFDDPRYVVRGRSGDFNVPGNEADLACNPRNQDNALLDASLSSSVDLTLVAESISFATTAQRSIEMSVQTLSPFTLSGDWPFGSLGVFVRTKEKPEEIRMALNVTGTSSWSDGDTGSPVVSRDDETIIQGTQTFQSRAYNDNFGVMRGIFIAPKTGREIPFMIEGTEDALGFDPSDTSLTLSIDEEWPYTPV